ncbi:4-alpha-glucanotransferase, partial [Chlamydia sp. 17-3921]
MNIHSSIEKLPTSHAWQYIGTSPKHGICVPLFSLHTQNSCGIGEFLDLIPLISWCKTSGFQIIQLLPLNDTGEDSSPYNSISSIALNPLFLSLKNLPEANSIPNASDKFQEMHKLCEFPTVHYIKVKNAKWSFLKEYYKRVGRTMISNNQAFQNFLKQESYWLTPYTIFRAIKNHMKGAPINIWPKAFTNPKNFL